MNTLPILTLAAFAAGSFITSAAAQGKAPAPDQQAAAPIFVPFDFYPRNHKALGFTEEQLRAMQQIAESMQQDTQKLESDRQTQTRALHEVMAAHPVDAERAMQGFRNVLEAENQLKVLQFRSSLAMRNALTPEQLGKVQTLAAKDGATRMREARAHLTQRVQQLRQEVQQRTGGNPPPEIIARIEQIEQSTRAGRLGEAKNQLEAVLRKLRGEPEPGSPAENVSKTPGDAPR